MLYLYDAIDCVRSKAHLLGMNTATTANETAKAMQTALDAALAKAGFPGLRGAFRVAGSTEDGAECLWLDSEYETLAPRASAFVVAYLAKHVPSAARLRDGKGKRMAWELDCSYARIVRREWRWTA